MLTFTNIKLRVNIIEEWDSKSQQCLQVSNSVLSRQSVTLINATEFWWDSGRLKINFGRGRGSKKVVVREGGCHRHKLTTKSHAPLCRPFSHRPQNNLEPLAPPPSFASDYVLPWKPRISLSVSKQLHAYSSADITLNLTCYQSTVVGLGKGEEGRCTVAQILTLIQSLYTYPITPFFSLRCIVKYSLSSPFAFWNGNLYLISYILPPVLYRLTWIS